MAGQRHCTGSPPAGAAHLARRARAQVGKKDNDEGRHARLALNGDGGPKWGLRNKLICRARCLHREGDNVAAEKAASEAGALAPLTLLERRQIELA
jgi:hypothetical protein